MEREPAVLCTPALHYMMMRRGREKRRERKGEEGGEEDGEKGRKGRRGRREREKRKKREERKGNRMRKERVLYCLYAGVAPTMITNQCHFSQVQAGEGKTGHGGNQRPSLSFLGKRERAEVSR